MDFILSERVVCIENHSGGPRQEEPTDPRGFSTNSTLVLNTQAQLSMWMR
jgi:hypothetical protein